MKITIVVPCYNEEEVLIDTTQQLTAVVKQLESAFELKADVLYVDDGSKDATWEMIQKFAAEDTHIHGLKLAHNALGRLGCDREISRCDGQHRCRFAG